MDRDKIALEYMKTILSNNERFLDYANEEDIMRSIASDSYKMADAMMEASRLK